MPLVGTSLSSATSTGAGIAVTFDTPKTQVSMQVTVTGSPSNYEVDLEVSLDGINFTQCQSIAHGGPNPGITVVPSGFFPVLSARGNLILLTGGTSPTVTAVIVAAE